VGGDGSDGDVDLDILRITGIAAPFTLVEPTPPFMVEPGETVTMRVRFAPTQTGTVRQALSVHSNDPDAPEVDVRLRGKGKRREGEVRD
jgi:hypothetical protein